MADAEMAQGAITQRRKSLALAPAYAGALPDPVPLHEVRRVLVTKLRHIGDVLLTSPVFSTLARATRDAEIDALVYRDTEPMLTGHPGISQIHTIRPQMEASMASRAKLRRNFGCCGGCGRGNTIF